jgi:hypothetical protein
MESLWSIRCVVGFTGLKVGGSSDLFLGQGGAVMVTKALLVRIEPPGQGRCRRGFLVWARLLVEEEPGTKPWLAVRFDASTFGIIEAFPDDEARWIHVAGPFAQELKEKAELFASPPQIVNLDVLADKLWPLRLSTRSHLTDTTSAHRASSPDYLRLRSLLVKWMASGHGPAATMVGSIHMCFTSTDFRQNRESNSRGPQWFPENTAWTTAAPTREPEVRNRHWSSSRVGGLRVCASDGLFRLRELGHYCGAESR